MNGSFNGIDKGGHFEISEFSCLKLPFDVGSLEFGLIPQQINGIMMVIIPKKNHVSMDSK